MTELTDLEICKRIAEIDGLTLATPNVMAEFYAADEAGVWVCGEISTKPDGTVNNCITPFNPLTDKALCFDLMVKYEISFSVEGEYNMASFEYEIDKPYGSVDICSQEFYDINACRAICRAIIGKHKD